MLGASAWFPFLPIQTIQLLTNNLLYDFSQVPIPTDNVTAQYIAKPRPWQMGEIAKFIIFIGPISSIFDYTTFCVMWFYFKCNHAGLVPPPELAARFAHAADPDHTSVSYTHLDVYKRQAIYPYPLYCVKAIFGVAHP